MGLDMYLTANRYMWYNEEELKDGVTRVFADLPEGVKAKEVTFEVGYWRKANHIHKWFVDHVQEGKDECQKSWVDKEKLQELRDTCQKVLDNRELAEKLLPTASGFFFGGTEYDEYYYNDIKDTIEIMDRALALPSGYEVEYQSSW